MGAGWRGRAKPHVAERTVTPEDHDVPEPDADAARLPILRVCPIDLTDVAIVVGDPARARMAASLLNDAEEIGNNREYLTLRGTRGGVSLVICSHGVGASGAGICFSELLRGGVRTLVRAGTCGAIVEGVGAGDLIVATSAVREDGASDHLIGGPYPAVADRHVSAALSSAAHSAATPVREGMVVTEANFYPGALPPRWQSYRGYGPVAVEMEMATLFVLATMNGARAGGILTVDGNLVETREPDMSDYDPHDDDVADGVAAMLAIALDAAAELAVETDRRSRSAY